MKEKSGGSNKVEAGRLLKGTSDGKVEVRIPAESTPSGGGQTSGQVRHKR